MLRFRVVGRPFDLRPLGFEIVERSGKNRFFIRVQILYPTDIDDCRNPLAGVEGLLEFLQ